MMDTFFLEIYATMRLSPFLWPTWLWVIAGAVFLGVVVAAVIQTREEGIAEQASSTRNLLTRGIALFAAAAGLHVLVSIWFFEFDSGLWAGVYLLMAYGLFGVAGAGWALLMTRWRDPFPAFWCTFLPLPVMTVVPQIVLHASRPTPSALIFWMVGYALLSLSLLGCGLAISRRAARPAIHAGASG